MATLMMNYLANALALLLANLAWLVALPTALTPLMPYVPWLLGALGLLCIVAAFLSSAEMRKLAHKTVAAIYRVAIKAAGEYGDEALTWLRGEDGIKYRKELAERAYDALPGNIGPVPVGMVKLWVSREKFCELVEAAFLEMCEMAERLAVEQAARENDVLLEAMLRRGPEE